MEDTLGHLQQKQETQNIMVFGLITQAATAVTTLVTVYFLGRESAASDFSTHEHEHEQEQNKSLRSSFHYYANKVGMKNESDMLHFQVPTEIVLPVATEVQDKEVVQLPVSIEMVLPVAT